MKPQWISVRLERFVRRLASLKHLQGDGGGCLTARCQHDTKRVDCDSDKNPNKNEPKEGENDSDDSCTT